jgi:CHAT domain-containing protein/Tfp pilus assembly protein PilF
MPRTFRFLASIVLTSAMLSFPGALALEAADFPYPDLFPQKPGPDSALECSIRPSTGIVIEEIANGSALEHAGLRQGDLIFSWEKSPGAAGERGEIESVLDWLWVEAEQAPRGGVTLTGQRKGEPRRFDIPLGHWEAKVLPRMSTDELVVYRKAEGLVTIGKVREGVAILNRFAAATEAERLRVWLRLRQAEVLSAAGIWEEAIPTYREAIATAHTPREKALIERDFAAKLNKRRELAPAAEALETALNGLEPGDRESLMAASLFCDLGMVAIRQRKLDIGQKWLDSALRLRERFAPASLDMAESLTALGFLPYLRDDWAATEVRWREGLAIREQVDPGSLDVAGSLANLSILAMNRGEPSKARDLLTRALAIQEKLAPGSWGMANILNNLGILAESQGDLEGAEVKFQRNLDIDTRLAPGGLDEANALNNLGLVAKLRGNTNAAQSYYERALAIKSKVAPETLNLASTLVNLGMVRKMRGDLDGAEHDLRQALAIQEKLSPGCNACAPTLGNLADIADLRGDLTLAERLSRQSLAINTKLSPDSEDVANGSNRLGGFALLRGDIDVAEDQIRKALRVYAKAAPKSLGTASSLINLGNVYLARGDLDAAADSLERAMEINQATAPDGPDVATILNNLGNIASLRGDLAKAQKYHERALALSEKISPEALGTALTLDNLGAIVLLQGNQDLAERLLDRAFRIRERLAHGSLMEAQSLKNLADAASRRGDLSRAKILYEQALANQEHLAPGTTEEADTLRALAAVMRKSGQPKDALSYLLRALTALESQVGRLGGSDLTRASFRAQYVSYYREAIGLLLELKRPEEAFHILERSRARSLLAMLAERDLAFSADIPSSLETRRRTVARRYEAVQQALEESGDAADSPKVQAFLRELTDLRRQHEDIAAEIRRASPRLATLQYPEPLDLAGAQSALDSGALALFYSVSEEATYLFAVRSTGPLMVATLPHGDARLRSEVGNFLSLLETAKPGPRIGEARQAALKAQARSLYKDLLEPAEALIEHSERLLIVPDGPLQKLPWGALRVGVSGTQYLSESKPLSIAPSITAFAELKRTRLSVGGIAAAQLAAFGDPLCRHLGAGPTGEISDAHVRAALSRGRVCDPLPASRLEVNDIGGLFPEHVRLHLGNDATEEEAKATGRDVRYLHFATHGILDERFPLDSAIVLTPPEKLEEGKENGLLQAWEIFEQVRLDADLVVLSACESGLGKEMGGEGLIGLTRAFQYAGARSVMASLWKISDRTTAELMVRFYKHLKNGLPKDEALRAAQMELIHGPIQVKNEKGEVKEVDASAPYYWAAFQIYGDWQ